MNFYISDLHIDHSNVISFDNRPFFTMQEMVSTIISNWNKAVKPTDKVYILGDFFWKNGNAPDILAKLNGKKYLIKGNHDKINDQMQPYFEYIKDYDEIKDNGRHVILCHYPIAHWKSADYGYIHLYGHIHAARDSRPFEEYKEQMRKRNLPYRCYNVGCMLPYMNYTPRSLDEIIQSNE